MTREELEQEAIKFVRERSEGDDSIFYMGEMQVSYIKGFLSGIRYCFEKATEWDCGDEGSHCYKYLSAEQIIEELDNEK